MTATNAGRSAQTCLLLDLDPDLGRGIDAEQWQDARHASRVNVIGLGPGPWAMPQSIADRHDIIALVVIDGVICRETAIGASAALELLCHEDVLLPPADVGAVTGVSLTALNAARLLVLSQPFIHAAARWPALLSNLNRRIETQRHRFAIQGLAVHLPRAEDRLLMTLWRLADRCGRVTPDGILLPLSLSHDILARLAAARRPTITLALGALEADDRIRRRQNGHLLLTDAGHRRVNQLTNETVVRPALGPSITLHTHRSDTNHRQPAAR